MGYDAVETVGQRDWPERVARPPFCRGCARDGRAVGAITAATCGCPGAQGEVVWMQQMSHNRIRCAARIPPFSSWTDSVFRLLYELHSACRCWNRDRLAGPRCFALSDLLGFPCRVLPTVHGPA